MESETLIEELGRFATPNVVDAVELFGVRPADQGYIANGITCRFPGLGRRVGYAVTMTYRTDRPPDSASGVDFEAYMDHILAQSAPRVLVGQDLSAVPAGVVFGEINATLHQGPRLQRVRNQRRRSRCGRDPGPRLSVHAAFIHVSRAYGHMEAFNVPVSLGSVTIRPGDLLHSDPHGVCLIPACIASKVPSACRAICAVERDTLDVSRGTSFTPGVYVKARDAYRRRSAELREHYTGVARAMRAQQSEELRQ